MPISVQRAYSAYVNQSINIYIYTIYTAQTQWSTCSSEQSNLAAKITTVDAKQPNQYTADSVLLIDSSSMRNHINYHLPLMTVLAGTCAKVTHDLRRFESRSADIST